MAPIKTEKQQITSAGKDAEKLCTIGGNVK